MVIIYSRLYLGIAVRYREITYLSLIKLIKLYAVYLTRADKIIVIYNYGVDYRARDDFAVIAKAVAVCPASRRPYAHRVFNLGIVV